MYLYIFGSEINIIIIIRLSEGEESWIDELDLEEELSEHSESELDVLDRSYIGISRAAYQRGMFPSTFISTYHSSTLSW